MNRSLFRIILLILFIFISFSEAKVVVQSGDRIAICGDSITAQKIYSAYVEAYILACSGIENVKCFNFGFGGEHAKRFTERMELDVWSWKPTVVTTCYGMNDGYYRMYEDQLAGVPYRNSMAEIVDFFKSKGAKVIIGTPGVVDIGSYKIRNETDANGYNETLAKLAQFDYELAIKETTGFANIHKSMMSAMLKAKAVLGKDYQFSLDGIHPGASGQLVMAYVFLKAMGLDGSIAKIEVDMKGQAKVSEGHTILSQKPGSVEIESIRYPFCFTGKAEDPAGNVSVLPFIPFQQDMNRFELKVNNLSKPKAEVIWGTKKKAFTKAELEKGINLAAEFIDNPFTSQFNRFIQQVRTKQGFEIWMIHSFFTNFKSYVPDADDNPKFKESLETMRKNLLKYQEKLDIELKQNLQPIKHEIVIVE